MRFTLMTVLLLGAAAAGAQTPDVSAARASVVAPTTSPPPTTPASSDSSSQNGYHDLICKPNGTEDGFDCADEATPAKIVPIPSQVVGPRPSDGPISG